MELQNLNEDKILSNIQMTKNKFLSMKNHLEALLQKKIRIESEIQLLRKAIKNKEKNFAFNLKTKVSLENFRPIVEQVQDGFKINFEKELPEQISSAWEELLEVTQDIDQVIKDYEEQFLKLQS